MMHRSVDDALEIPGPRRPGIDSVVDVHPGIQLPVRGADRHPVAAVANGDTLGAVQGGQVAVGDLPDDAVHLGSGEGFDGGDTAFVDQPVVFVQERVARIDGIRAATRHLLHAQVGPVREVEMTRRQEFIVRPIRQRRACYDGSSWLGSRSVLNASSDLCIGKIRRPCVRQHLARSLLIAWRGERVRSTTQRRAGWFIVVGLALAAPVHGHRHIRDRRVPREWRADHQPGAADEHDGDHQQ